MSNLKYRLLVIAALVAASLWALFPRTTVERVQRNGTFVSDTVRRVPLKLGLDLQGGMYLAMELDQSRGAVQNPREAVERSLSVVRKRIDGLGVSEPVIQRAGDDRIVVELPGVDDPERAQQVIEQAAFLEFQITDKTQALERSLPRLDAAVARLLPSVAANASAGAAPATGAPASPLGGLLQAGAPRRDSAQADSSRRDTARRDSGTVVASSDSATRRDSGATARNGAFSRAITPGQLPGQYFVSAADYDRLRALVDSPSVAAAMPPGKVLRWGADSIVDPTRGTVFRSLYVLDSRPIITGEYLTNARPQTDPVEGNKVEFQLSREGGRRFQNETARHIRDNMAVVLDRRVITAPQIQSAIGTNGQITLGGGSLQEAQDLAIVLQAGALPVPLKVAETREVGASLGADSIRNGMLALGIAVGLIVAVMLVYYRLSGAFAVAALVLYILLTLAMLAGFNAALTLPGLAGLVLSVGIAVDGNVLVFERIREELERGKPTRTAVDEGFRHALSAIVDTSVTTALTAVVLYQYGTGPVRGFAVTLLVGIVASFFTVVFVTRTFFMAWLASPARAQRPLSI